MAREGEKNGRAKLTWQTVKEARERYRKGRPFQRNPVSVFNLALDYDVSPGTMWQALAGATWKNSKRAL